MVPLFKTRPIAWLLMIVTVPFGTGCSGLPAKHIHTEIDIDASPREVWNILADNARYPEWNPYHVRVDGELEVGASLSLEIHKPNGERIEIEPRVLRIVPQRELTWGGGIPGIFYGEHVFELAPRGRTGTRLVHRESFKGIAIPFASLDAIEEGYRQMNHALKQRAETDSAASMRRSDGTTAKTWSLSENRI